MNTVHLEVRILEVQSSIWPSPTRVALQGQTYASHMLQACRLGSSHEGGGRVREEAWRSEDVIQGYLAHTKRPGILTPRGQAKYVNEMREKDKIHEASSNQVPPRQSLRRGRQKSISPKWQWFSKVRCANIGAFEGFYPLHHSGVAPQS